MPTRPRKLAIVAFQIAFVLVIIAPARDTNAAIRARPWKGAETLNHVAAGPNLARCGAFPRNIEARFSGLGVDTEGGPYTVLASGCLDTEADLVFDLEATDT